MENTFSPRIKLWITSPAISSFLGDGKWLLLKAIVRYSSLKAACLSLGISYRKAWGSLKRTEMLCGIKLITRQRGGKQGGSTILTETGSALLAAYTGFRREVCLAMEDSFKKHFNKTLEEITCPKK